MANLTPVNSFDNVVQLETNTIALGGAGGIMNAQAQALANRTENLRLLLLNKLDASAYVQHYRGKFVSLVALQTALPTANDGDYAIVDTGIGDDAAFYIWDAQDEWVGGGSISGSTTDDIAEGSTNLYFTNARAISALTATINAAITAALEPTINPQTGTSYTVGTVGTDNNGKTILHMDNEDPNTPILTSAQTLPISICQFGAGVTTITAGAGVTAITGNLVFSARYQTKTIYRVSAGVYNVVG